MKESVDGKKEGKPVKRKTKLSLSVHVSGMGVVSSSIFGMGANKNLTKYHLGCFLD